MDHHFITPSALAAILHRHDAPAILDLRMADDAAADPRTLPCAQTITLAEIEAGAGPTGSVVTCCQKGGKISQLAAGMLRARGVPALSLRHGHLGWVAAGLQLRRVGRPADRWVMPLDPGWDDLAALWVLRRLVDRTAPILPVERDWLSAAADIWDARILPPTPVAMAELAVLDHPALDALGGGPTALLAGRLTRVATPEDTLDLVDDWLAGAQVAA